MKTDKVLQSEVIAELGWDPSIQSENIGVLVHEGIVTLTGNIPTYDQKMSSEKAARRVDGVRGIAEELNVELKSTHKLNDNDIAQSATAALAQNVSVSSSKINVTVENGSINLGGQVDWNYQRQAALDAVRHLIGVKGVTNLIKVKNLGASSEDIRESIGTALKRNTAKEAKGIKIDVKDGKVTLIGNVKSWADRDDAASAAWSVPGVSTVANFLLVVHS